MVSELGECILCFANNRGQFVATGSDLGNGIRKFVKSKEDFNMCVLSQNPTYIQYIFKYKIHTYITYIYITHLTKYYY